MWIYENNHGVFVYTDRDEAVGQFLRDCGAPSMKWLEEKYAEAQRLVAEGIRRGDTNWRLVVDVPNPGDLALVSEAGEWLPRLRVASKPSGADSVVIEQLAEDWEEQAGDESYRADQVSAWIRSQMQQ